MSFNQRWIAPAMLLLALVSFGAAITADLTGRTAIFVGAGLTFGLLALIAADEGPRR